MLLEVLKAALVSETKPHGVLLSDSLRTTHVKSVRVDVPYRKFSVHEGVTGVDLVFDSMAYSRGEPAWCGYYTRPDDDKYVRSKAYATPSAVVFDALHNNEGVAYDSYTVTIKAFDGCFIMMGGKPRYYTAFTEMCGINQIDGFVQQIDDLFDEY